MMRMLATHQLQRVRVAFSGGLTCRPLFKILDASVAERDDKQWDGAIVGTGREQGLVIRCVEAQQLNQTNPD